MAIGESLKYFPQLQILDLSLNYIGITADNGTIAIGESLKYLAQLQTLDLSLNYIGYTGDTGTIAIGGSLQYFTDLQTLDLSNNFIGTAGVQSLFTALPQLICHDLNLKTLNLQNLNSQGNNSTNIPWSQAASALEGQYSGQIQQACEANRCFGTLIGAINQTAIQCRAVNTTNPFVPLQQEDCPIPIAAASSLSPSFILSLFMMSQRKAPVLALLTLWLFTLNFLAEHP